MSKGTYDVQKGEVARRNGRDSSYGSFLCAILIFLILCVIIIIAGNWNSFTGGKNKSRHDDARKKEHGESNPKEDMEYFQKIVLSSTDSQPPQTTKSLFTQPITTMRVTHHTTTTTTVNPEHQITTRKMAATENSAQEILTKKPTSTENPTYENTPSVTSKHPHHQITTSADKPMYTENTSRLNAISKTPSYQSSTTENLVPHITTYFDEKSIATKENYNKEEGEYSTTPGDPYYSEEEGIEDYHKLIKSTTVATEDIKLSITKVSINDNQVETTASDDFTTILEYEDVEEKNIIHSKHRINPEISKGDSESTTDATNETVENVTSLSDIITDSSTENKLGVRDQNQNYTNDSKTTTHITSLKSDPVSSYVTRTEEENKLHETTTEYLTTNSTITSDVTKYIIRVYTRYQEAAIDKQTTTNAITENFTTDDTTDPISNYRKYDDESDKDIATDLTIEDSTTDATEETVYKNKIYNLAALINNNNIDSTTEDITTDSTSEDITMDSTSEDITTDSITEYNSEYVINNLNKSNKTVSTEDYNYTTSTESTTYEGSGLTTDSIVREDEEENISTIKPEKLESSIQNSASSLHYLYQPTTTVSIDDTTIEDAITINGVETSTIIYPNVKHIMESTTEKINLTTIQNTPLTPRLISVENQRAFKEDTHVCKTRECKSIASNMLSLMDDAEDACEDFYKFSCGSAHNTHTNTAVWDILLKQMMQIKNTSSSHLFTFRSFYDSCVDFHYKFSYQERVDKVKMLLKSYGMESFQSAKICEMDHIFQKLLSLNSMYFMEISVDVSDDDKHHILQLGPSLESSGEIGPWSALRANQRRCLAEQRHKIYDAHLNLKKIHESYAECLEDHVEFRQLLHDAIEAFGYGKNEGINLHYTINYLNKLLGIRPSRAEIFQAISNKNATIMTVGNLQREFPVVNWKNIFNVVRGEQVHPEQEVHVYFIEYITKWFEIFSNIKEQKWLLINLLITDLYYNFVVHKVNNDVQDYCLKTSVTFFRDIASNLYVNNFPDAFTDKQEKRVHDVFLLLKSQFHDNLKNSSEFSVMSSYLDNMTFVFSTKREVDSDKKLIRKYDDFGKYFSYQEYLLRAKEFQMYHLGDIFGSKVNTFDRNPTSFYQRNKIYIPLGMVVDIPLSIPNHIILAKIGIKLAQSIAKHFDPVSITLQHSQLSKKNSYEDLISNTDMLLPYIEKKFNKFTVKVDAAMTINERMSDNTALRLLTDVHIGTKNDSVVPWISSSYPREKVMLVAVAQEFCDEKNVLDFMIKMHEGGELPGAIRVYNMFMNSEAFGKVFECAQGSGMNESPLKTQFPYANALDEFAEDNVETS